MFIAVLAVVYTSDVANACTNATVCYDDVVLFGNNEDYTNRISPLRPNSAPPACP